jgi:hypothetical protein
MGVLDSFLRWLGLAQEKIAEEPARVTGPLADFDPRKDLKVWFRAKVEIDELLDAPERRAAVLQQHGIRDEEHFQQIADEVERFFRCPGAGKVEEDAENLAAGDKAGSEEPFPFERWVEIHVTLERAAAVERNREHTLQQFGLTPESWYAGDTWWNRRFHDLDLHQRYGEVRARYEAQFSQ